MKTQPDSILMEVIFQSVCKQGTQFYGWPSMPTPGRGNTSDSQVPRLPGPGASLRLSTTASLHLETESGTPCVHQCSEFRKTCRKYHRLSDRPRPPAKAVSAGHLTSLGGRVLVNCPIGGAAAGRGSANLWELQAALLKSSTVIRLGSSLGQSRGPGEL